MSNQIISAECVKKLLHYCPDTGVFTWIVSIKSTRAGDIANSTQTNGYKRIKINRKSYKAHRLAWLYMHGEFPNGHIDHINGIVDDNRINNLREATPSQNQQNIRSAQAGSTHGYLGATFNKEMGKWCARIKIPGKRLHLGYFATAIEAHRAYLDAKRIHHPYSMI